MKKQIKIQYDGVNLDIEYRANGSEIEEITSIKWRGRDLTATYRSEFANIEVEIMNQENRK